MWSNDIAYSQLPLLWHCPAFSHCYRSMQEMGRSCFICESFLHITPTGTFCYFMRRSILLFTDLYSLLTVPAFGLLTQFDPITYSFPAMLCHPSFTRGVQLSVTSTLYELDVFCFQLMFQPPRTSLQLSSSSLNITRICTGFVTEGSLFCCERHEIERMEVLSSNLWRLGEGARANMPRSIKFYW